jgi:hypothetical protein
LASGLLTSILANPHWMRPLPQEAGESDKCLEYSFIHPFIPIQAN